VEVSAYSKAQLLTYDHFRDGILTERSVLLDAKREGEAIGMEKERKEIAIACLKKGLPIKEISELTGLATDEILALNEY
jgi:predicted transposase YdaD